LFLATCGYRSTAYISWLLSVVWPAPPPETASKHEVAWAGGGGLGGASEDSEETLLRGTPWPCPEGTGSAVGAEGRRLGCGSVLPGVGGVGGVCTYGCMEIASANKFVSGGTENRSCATALEKYWVNIT